ncbi:hypothetical protein V8F20_002363 [Naviculisporaceae sp. PSN 640]
MVTTRRQASIEKPPSTTVNESDSEDSDSSSDIPATTSTVRKTGPSHGPTLRPSKTPQDQSPVLKRKRASINHTTPAKRQKRAQVATHKATTTTQSALDSINAFRPNAQQSPRIVIPLPTSTQLLANMQENQQLGGSVSLGTRDRTPMSTDQKPPVGRILFNDRARPTTEREETASSLEAANGGHTIVVGDAPSRDLYTIQESPQVESRFGNPPGTDTDNQNQNQIDPINEIEDSEDEEDGPARDLETQYHTARDHGSPDLGSDQRLDDIYAIPEDEEPSGQPMARILLGSRGSADSAHSASMPVSEYIAQTRSHTPVPSSVQPINVHKEPNGLPRLPPVVVSSQVPPPAAQPTLSSPPASDVDMADGDDEDEEVTEAPSASEGSVRFFPNSDDMEDLEDPADAEDDIEEEGVDDILDDVTEEEEEPKPAPTRNKASRATHASRPRVNGTLGLNGGPPQSTAIGGTQIERNNQLLGSSRQAVIPVSTPSVAAGRDRVSAGANNSPVVHAPESVVTPTITVTSSHVGKLHKLMGQPGWTELGTNWNTDLVRDPRVFDDDHEGEDEDGEDEVDDTPALTGLGKLLFKTLALLSNNFETAPSVPELEKQNEWLLRSKQSLTKYVSEIDKFVRKICDDRLAVLGDSERPSSNNLESRKALVQDLVLCLIPMLIDTLRQAFWLGGHDNDVQTNAKILPIEGAKFTSTTLRYVDCLTGWLIRLDRVLMFELEQRPFYRKLIAGLSVDRQTEYPARCQKERGKLNTLLTRLKFDLKAAREKLDKLIQQEKRKAERLRMAPILKARQEQAARAEEEKVRKQREAFAASTQRIAEQNRRKQEKERQYWEARRQAYTQTETVSPERMAHNRTIQGYGDEERRGQEISRLYRATHRNLDRQPRRPAARTLAPGPSSTANRGRERYNSSYNRNLDEEDEEYSSVTEARDPREQEEEEDDDEDPFARETPPSRRQAQKPVRRQVQPAPQQAEPRPPQHRHPKWSEEDLYFLLRQIRREEGKRLADRDDYEAIAQTLEKPLVEVMAEAANLRWGTRDLARERGLPVPKWAWEK